MAKKKDDGQRRVYVLPTDLVERIASYQNLKGFPSEVHAVRKLLDDALKSQDVAEDIILRFQNRMDEVSDLTEVARDVLVGHPLVTSIGFQSKQMIHFTVKGDGEYRIDDMNNVERNNPSTSVWESWPSAIDLEK